MRGSGTQEMTQDVSSGGVADRTYDGTSGYDATESAEAVDPLVGRRLLHYLVEESIGQGGMSMVYRGHDELLHRPVAIKVLHPFLAKKQECRARLAREARAVARLEHENILKIFAYSGDPPTKEERPNASGEEVVSVNGVEEIRSNHDGFLVTEYVPGDTLKRFWVAHRMWEVPEAGGLCCWVLAKALAHAHAQGVIHRDLKPENVMARDDGVLKLMDFGIAQVADAKSLTVTGTLLGSPAHMAPESIEGKPADERSDIFSLGTVLYWLMTGELPFEALTPHALLKAIVDADYTPPQQRQPRISDDLLQVLRKAMAKRPDDRFDNADAFADALQEVLERSGIEVSSGRASALLANPSDELEPLRQNVRRAFLDRASQLLDDGSAAKALSVLGRVMADFPNDDEVSALLERLHDIPDDELEPEGEAGIGDSVVDDSASFDDAFAREESSLVHAPRDGRTDAVAPPASPPRPRWAPWVATLSIGILLAVTAWIAQQVDGPGTSASTTGTDGDQLSITEKRKPLVRVSRTKLPRDKASPVDDDGKAARAGRGERPRVLALRKDPHVGKRNLSEKLRRLRAGPAPLASTQTKPPPNENASETAVAAAGTVDATPRAMELRVRPWADVFVDGKKVASEVKSTTLHLLPGTHTVVLKNHMAKEWRREVDIPVEGKGRVPKLQVKLKPKPASLVVQANVDADILLVEPSTGRRLFVGRSRKSEQTPVQIELPAGSERTYEVVLTKAGFRTERVKRRFTTGKTEIVRAVLQAEPNASAAVPSDDNTAPN